MANVGDSSWIGVDEYNDPESVPVGYFSYGENTRVERGQITGRGGHVPVMWGQSSYSSTPTPPGNAYEGIEYVDNTSKRNRFLVFGATGAWLYEVSGGVTSYAYPSGESLTSTNYQIPAGTTGSQTVNTGTFAISSVPVAVQALNTIYLFRGDGIIPLQFPKHDGTLGFDYVYTDATNPVAGGVGGYLRMPWGNSAVWTSQNRLAVLMGDALYPSNVASLSAPLPIEYFNPTITIPIAQGSGDLSTGVTEYDQNTLIVTKQKSARIISGFSGDLGATSGVYPTVSPVVGCSGCVAPKAIFPLGGNVNGGPQSSTIYIPNAEGIYPILRVFQTQTESKVIDFSLNVHRSYRLANWSAFSNSIACFFEGLLYLAIPTGSSTVNNRVLVYSTITGGWVGSDTFDPSYAPVAFLKLKEGGKLRLFAVSSTGVIYRYAFNTGNILDGLGSDGTSSYPMIVNTRGYTTAYKTPYTAAYQYIASPRASFSIGQLRTQVFNPNFTVSLLGSSTNKVIPLKIQGGGYSGTRNRLKYTIAGKTLWDPTNANYDADNPYREDYSICLGASSFIIDNPAGDHPFWFQEGRVNFTGVGRGRFFQIQIMNYTGQIKMLALDSGIQVAEDVQSSGKETE